MAPFKIGETVCGRYAVEKLIASGGMGDVYRGTDTKLADRTVAIKALRPRFEIDEVTRKTFVNEVRSLSRLNHPHIATLYDICTHDDSDFIVMEYVVGETLSAVLQKRKLSEPEALTYAIQIADALAYAHEQGVIHRDVKPNNILVTPKGIKLIDFGLARLDEQRQIGQLLEHGDTPSTEGGTIVGTPFYMSPEQMAGSRVDFRTDIYSFGLVAGQILTGFSPSAGSVSANRALVGGMLAQIGSPSLRMIIDKCVAYEAADRWQHTRDLLYAFRLVAEKPATTAVKPAARSRKLAFGLVALLLAAVAAFGYWRPRAAPTAQSQYHFSVAPPAGLQLGSLEASGPAAISPDGETLAFVAGDESGETSIWIRRLNSVEATPLTGTRGASHPFWSPDSRSIGFFVPGRLMRIDLTGGGARILAPAPNGRGGSWGLRGIILFTPGFTESLYRVSAEGGSVEPVTKLDFTRRETSHRWPTFLPDGNHFVFLVRSDQTSVHGLYFSSLDDPKLSRVGSITTSAAYLQNPHTGESYLVFAERGFLAAQRFRDGQLVGTAEDITPVAPEEDTSVVPASASLNGILVHSGGNGGWQPVTWFDMNGQEMGGIGVEGQFRNPRVSPDGKKVVMEKLELRTGRSSLWMFDLERDLQQRLILTPGSALSPVWETNGKSVLFVSYRGTQWELTRRDIADELKSTALRAGGVQAVTDWSRNGEWVLYQELGPGPREQWDIGALNLKTGKDQKLISSPNNEHQAQLSPDGSWLAYVSNESGSDQIYLQRFPSGTNRVLVSEVGGSQPKWRADGRELFYVSRNSEMMRARVDLKSDSPVLGLTQRIFTIGLAPLTGIFAVSNYDLDSHANRFLVIGPSRVQNAQQIDVIVNWAASRRAN